MSKIVGYKVFNPDWTCRGYDFKTALDEQGNSTAVGSVHIHSGAVEVCGSGFHFCEKVGDCFSYYSFNPTNKVALVEGEGCTEQKEDSKRSCAKLSIVREISWEELLVIANNGSHNNGHSNTGHRNTGHRNTGDWNTGDWNTGDWNTGHRNTGHRNTGDQNTGDWNTGHRNTGHRNTGDRNTGDWNTVSKETGSFNTEKTTTIRVFNKPCPLTTWEEAYKPSFLYFQLTYWCEEENKQKAYDYKEAFIKSWEVADKQDRIRVKDLPNFDSDVFFEISGIRVEDYE